MSKNLRSLLYRKKDQPYLLQKFEEIAADADQNIDQQVTSLAEERLISKAAIRGTYSFYDFLKAEEQTKQVHLCDGTSCMLSAHHAQHKTLLEKTLGKTQVGKIKCLGNCHQPGNFLYQQKVYTCEQLPEVSADLKTGAALDISPHQKIPFYRLAREAILSGTVEYQSLYKLARMTPTEMMEEIELSKLQGRGGAGFPFALKLKACAQAAGKEKYIVCNADEGDPGAYSDQYLLEEQPDLILVGMLVAGICVGASTGILYIRHEYPKASRIIAESIAEFEKTDLFQEIPFQFRIVQGAGAYICGEETALLNSIEGLRPEVRVRPPYPTQAGLFGFPTLLANVETFACLPWILQSGGKSFASLGSEKSKGNKLVCLNHLFKRPGVYEVEMGLPLSDLISKAGGFRQPVKALQIGGPLGGVVPEQVFNQLTLDFESLANQGFLLGHGSIVAIPSRFPMIDFLRHLFRFMADESCGKCFPCRMGTEKGSQLLAGASPESPLKKETLAEILDTLQTASLCGLGSGLPVPVRQIMHYFADEISEFVT